LEGYGRASPANRPSPTQRASCEEAGQHRLNMPTHVPIKTQSEYVALNRWVMNQPWWSAPDPQDETSLHCGQRAALLDILTYSGDPSKGTRFEGDYDDDDE
jgi:hypothetical protein